MDIFSQEGSMLLEEEIDESYEPTEEEIIEYAKYLGMDEKKDRKYFDIAREGLKAPLPEKWKPYKNSKGDIYYINIETNQAVYEHPCDNHYRKLFQQKKAKDLLAEKPKNTNQLSLGMNKMGPNSFSFQKTNKEFRMLDSFSLEQSKTNSNESINQFQMLNDSFSDNSGNLTEKTAKNEMLSQKSAENQGITELEMGEIDLETNEKIIELKKRKEDEFQIFMKDLELKRSEKEKELKITEEKKKGEVWANLKTLEEKARKERKEMEESLCINGQLKVQQKIRQQTEKFNSMKKKYESKVKAGNNESLKNYEENLKAEIRQKKSKAHILKNESERKAVYKAKINENKKKLLQNKINEDERPLFEKDFSDKLAKFYELEKAKSNEKLKELKLKLEKSFGENFYKLQKDENEEKNRNLLRKKELKEIFLKRFDKQKTLEQEKMKEILKNYEQELKNKMQRKVETILTNKSSDIRDSLNNEKKMRNPNSSFNKAKPLKIFEDSSEKVNPMNLIEKFNNSEAKEKRPPSVIESNEIQIRKIRNEISSLKSIINFSLLSQNKNREGGYLLQTKEKTMKNSKGFQRDSLIEIKKREWLNITIQERNFINNIKLTFKKIKVILKKAQQNAILEEGNLKKEIRKYMEMRENSQIKKKLIKDIKKKFLKKVHQISSDIFCLKEQEISLKSKENQLMELENAFNKMSIKGTFDFEELGRIYSKYKSITINETESFKILTKGKVHENFEGLELKDDESSLSIEQWTDFIQSYNFEADESLEFSDCKQSFLIQQQNNDCNQRKAMKSQSFDRTNNEKRNPTCANSLQILKNRLNESNFQAFEAGNVNIEKYSFQKSLLKCHDNKDRVRKIFDNHSLWLKNMRNELNRTLYSNSMHISNISTDRNSTFY